MGAYQMNTVTTDDGVVSEICFGGELILSEIESIKHELFDLNFSGNENVQVLINEVTELDLSFLQLLNSIEKQVGESRLAVKWSLGDEMLALLDRAGFSSVLKLNQ